MFSSISCLFTPTSQPVLSSLCGWIFPRLWPGSSGSPWVCRLGSGSLPLLSSGLPLENLPISPYPPSLSPDLQAFLLSSLSHWVFEWASQTEHTFPCPSAPSSAVPRASPEGFSVSVHGHSCLQLLRPEIGVFLPACSSHPVTGIGKSSWFYLWSISGIPHVSHLHLCPLVTLLWALTHVPCPFFYSQPNQSDPFKIWILWPPVLPLPKCLPTILSLSCTDFFFLIFIWRHA